MSEITVESLQAEILKMQTALDEASKGQMSKEDRERLTYLEGDNKKMIEARDKAKEEKRVLEEKSLVENGEFKTLAETRAAEVTDLTGKLDGLSAKLEAYQERDKVELATLLESVPEELREDVSDLPLEKALTLAKKLAGTKQTTPPITPRIPGEPEPETLQAQHAAAMKKGDIGLAMQLKRQIHAA